MNKITLTIAAALLTFAAEAAKKPNLIFIMVDDAGYGDFSCYGQKKFTTPNIDRMAARGSRVVESRSSGGRLFRNF